MVIAVSLSLLQYLEPPPAVAKDHMSGQLIGGPRTSSSKAQHSWQHAFQVMVTTQADTSRCMFWFGEPRADWHGVFWFCFLLCSYFLIIFYINLQEATSLVAKAEVLQASVGVSCNEVDIQATTQDHNEDASEDAYPESSSAVQDGAGIDGGVDAIDADELSCTDSLQAVPPSIDLFTSSANGSLVWLKQRYKSIVTTLCPWHNIDTNAVIPFWPAC